MWACQLIGRSFGLGAKLGDGVVEVDGVPEDDGGDREVEAGGTVALVFEECGPGSPRDDRTNRARDYARALGVRITINPR